MGGNVNLILWSMTAMASFGVAACFARFWRQTADRLFGFFALAFTLLGGNTLLLAALNPSHESRHLAYLLRLGAFVVIIIGVIDKNRTRS